VKDPAWVRTPWTPLCSPGWRPTASRPRHPADKRTLLRRVYFDLLGLPPSPEEMDEFLADPAPDAYERVVDRLLASPRYGERWGRHWLDVARYADTRVRLPGRTPFAFSYTYRDYVIAAFNADKPYDRFLLEQIAADRLAANPPVAAKARLPDPTAPRSRRWAS